MGSSYNFKVVTYEATGEQDIVIYSNPIKIRDKDEKEDKKTEIIEEEIVQEKVHKSLIDFINAEQIIEEGLERSIRTSLNRTKNKIYDYSRANIWEYFVTLTFNKEKVDRYNYDDVTKKLSNWLDNIKKRKASNLKYIIVPELHEDGAIHFHGLLADTGNIVFTDSFLKTRKGQVIYNIDSYKLGFTTATKVKDTLKASNYITKYVTKELVTSTKNKRRYWNSKNLEVGSIEKSYLDSESIKNIKNIYRDNKRYKKIVVDLDNYYNEIEYITI